MRWLVLLLLVPAVSAGVGHSDPSVPMTMYIHHTADGIALHPSTPGDPILGDGAEVDGCEPVSWTARFTRGPVDDPSWDELVRTADFDDLSPRLTWYMEVVHDGEPFDVTLPMQVDAVLRGDDVVAQGSTTSINAVEVEGRNVLVAEIRMPWRDDNATIDGAMELDVTAQVATPADCPATPIGLRPYADAEHHNRIRWDVQPVRIDLFEAGWSGETLVIRVHASSPWGPLDLAAPAPVITTPTGDKIEATLDAVDAAGPLAQTWAWDAAGARNGTYRVDALVSNADGSNEVSNFTTFRVGGDAVEPDRDPPAKKSPGLALPILGAILVGLGRRR